MLSRHLKCLMLFSTITVASAPLVYLDKHIRKDKEIKLIEIRNDIGKIIQQQRDQNCIVINDETFNSEVLPKNDKMHLNNGSLYHQVMTDLKPHAGKTIHVIINSSGHDNYVKDSKCIIKYMVFILLDIF